MRRQPVPLVAAITPPVFEALFWPDRIAGVVKNVKILCQPQLVPSPTTQSEIAELLANEFTVKQFPSSVCASNRGQAPLFATVNGIDIRPSHADFLLPSVVDMDSMDLDAALPATGSVATPLSLPTPSDSSGRSRRNVSTASFESVSGTSGTPSPSSSSTIIVSGVIRVSIIDSSPARRQPKGRAACGAGAGLAGSSTSGAAGVIGGSAQNWNTTVCQIVGSVREISQSGTGARSDH